MKFLVDECLSPGLAAVARERGYPESTHVTWLGLRARQDWALVRRALADGYVLVTNDRGDFTELMQREQRHPGLVCITVAHGLMSLDVQTRLFERVLTELSDLDIAGRILEIALHEDGRSGLTSIHKQFPDLKAAHCRGSAGPGDKRWPELGNLASSRSIGLCE